MATRIQRQSGVGSSTVSTMESTSQVGVWPGLAFFKLCFSSMLSVHTGREEHTLIRASGEPLFKLSSSLSHFIDPQSIPSVLRPSDSRIDLRF